MTRVVLAAVMSLFGSICMAQAPSVDKHKALQRVCQLISANRPDFNPFQFIPKKLDVKGLNRFPKVAYVVHDDGSVSDVKILKGTGSPKVDAGLIKSIQAWKYQPQPGCTIDTLMSVVIDIF